MFIDDGIKFKCLPVGSYSDGLCGTKEEERKLFSKDKFTESIRTECAKITRKFGAINKNNIMKNVIKTTNIFETHTSHTKYFINGKKSCQSLLVGCRCLK